MQDFILSKMISFLPLIAALLFTVAIESDLEKFLFALGSCFTGAVILGYLKRDKSKIEWCFRMIAATISGLICGSIAIKYFGLTDREYMLGAYSFSAFLSLIFLDAILVFSEKNAKEIVLTASEKIFKFKPKENNQIFEKHSSDKLESVTTKQTEIKITKDK